MNRDIRIEDLLKESNYDLISQNISDFVKTYIEILLHNLLTYVDDDIKINKIETVNDYCCNKDLSLNINGVPSAFSVIDAVESVLISFTEKYSRLDITEYNAFAKESLLDFLNLNNGLLTVELSKRNICELNINKPLLYGSSIPDSNISGDITVISIDFSYGNIKFLLCKLN